MCLKTKNQITNRMNITLKNTDSVNAIVKIDIVKNDYSENIETSLRKFRQKADIPGFRKGMAPAGMIKKMYGEAIMAEEINKLVSEKLFSYIRENKLNILGEPIPNETEQKEINFGTQEDFEFCFDIGLAPEIAVDINKKDKLPYYTIKIDDELLNKQIESYKANYGTYKQVDEFSGKDMLKGTLSECENGSIKSEGLHVEEAVMMPSYIKDDAEKAKFENVKKGDVIIYNPYKSYEGNETELSSFFKISKEDVNKYNGDFSYEIKEITHYEEAELNEELFNRVFPEENVKTETEFKEKVREQMASQYESNSDYKFLLDARNLLEKKAGNLQFPDAFLKRWMLVSDKNRSIESIEEDYPKIIEDLKFHLIKEQLVKDNDIKLEEGDLITYAKRAALAQFAQYGMASVPNDILENYAKDMLKKQETVQHIADRAIEDKLIKCIKEKVHVDEKQTSIDEFTKLFEK